MFGGGTFDKMIEMYCIDMQRERIAQRGRKSGRGT